MIAFVDHLDPEDGEEEGREIEGEDPGDDGGGITKEGSHDVHELESKSDEDFPSENVRVYREGSNGPGKHRQARVLHGPDKKMTYLVKSQDKII